MRSQSLLLGNLDALKRHCRGTADWLHSQPINPALVLNALIRNRWGLLDWPLASGKGMFEPAPPIHFYQNWPVKQDEKPTATIIIGCNLGYGLNHLLANIPNTDKVFVVEPRAEMMIACLGLNDYRPFLSTQKLFFLPPDETQISHTIFSELDLYFEFGRILMRGDLPSQQLGPDYARWCQKCEEILDDFRLDMNTIRGLQNLMIQNELNNFHRALEDGSIKLLENQAKGLTAVLLGAGPSLEQFAPIIASHHGDALLISALQSLPALHKYGLRPHLCMAIDPTPGIKKVFDGLEPDWVKDIPLIYACKVLPEVVNAYPGPTLPMWTQEGLGPTIWKGKEPVLNDGGNVAVALTRFLIWCGVSKIVLVGQDFAWCGEKVHASGTEEKKTRFRPDPKKIKVLKNKEGKNIHSHATYITALRALERTIQTLDIPVYNLYGGFAAIQGAREVTWDEILSRNILKSYEGSRDHFLCKLNEARAPIPPPAVNLHNPDWWASLAAVKKKIEKFSKKPGKKQQEIYSTLNRLLNILNRNPLYRPYLLNEIFATAGILFASREIGWKDFTFFKKILTRAQRKAREIDRNLASLPVKIHQKAALD
ncbi:MAG: motility associated factor glycosyltransferase family protein [Deltaproteobacteria bacterium]|nr:motility associated factor glycosyltransferase family protein [Deltaproteobacteria bacterium]MBW1962896.1 motility associated factor glycosyltransferase family protein [Deltaproteobacteria bacterium]MBW2154368.1 motility associated factor glycosyltransferase family protein [Deltaproteobacteria bacterium]